jgi:uncharacterized protein with PIN domain
VQASIRFHGELTDHGGGEPIRKTFVVPGSVKDLIESCGVPHTEVGRIERHGALLDPAELVRDGDSLDVHPATQRGDRFVLDVHLGKLAAYLRMLGFDTLYRSCYTDPELVRTSLDEDRVLLTRDRGLLKHGVLTRGYWLRETDSRAQLREIVRRFDLTASMRPFTRCMACNGELADIKKEEALAGIPPRVAREFDHFRRCPCCRRVYWPGSHYRRMQDRIAAL